MKDGSEKNKGSEQVLPDDIEEIVVEPVEGVKPERIEAAPKVKPRVDMRRLALQTKKQALEDNTPILHAKNRQHAQQASASSSSDPCFQSTGTLDRIKDYLESEKKKEREEEEKEEEEEESSSLNVRNYKEDRDQKGIEVTFTDLSPKCKVYVHETEGDQITFSISKENDQPSEQRDLLIQKVCQIAIASAEENAVIDLTLSPEDKRDYIHQLLKQYKNTDPKRPDIKIIGYDPKEKPSSRMSL